MKKVLVLTSLVVASTGLAEGWTPRVSAFHQKQAEERKRLGLDSAKAKKAYPTPEVRFGNATSWACPGEATTLLLEGKLSPGTLVGTSSDAVEIVKEEVTPKGWQATLKVKPGTKGPITLQLIAPVSGITSSIELPIGCPRDWVIDLKNGDKLVLKVIDGESRAPGEWFRANKSLEARTFQVIADAKTFTVSQQESSEDRERVKKAQEPLTGAALANRQHELTEKMQGCAQMGASQMAACIQKYSGELQELMGMQQAAVETAQSAAAPRVGCVQLQGTIEGKKLKGSGMNCSAKQPSEAMPFTGSIK
ncbi:MAG: hypothetical protein Q8N23_05120 [Archangium sp.]|nr:hypothetical protein [Archangium sp.]MDP3152027.1 hypothetical protein [Archangium sp.]MDP3575487.1 hypothetical protein [Archangium sp.]